MVTNVQHTEFATLVMIEVPDHNGQTAQRTMQSIFILAISYNKSMKKIIQRLR